MPFDFDVMKEKVMPNLKEYDKGYLDGIKRVIEYLNEVEIYNDGDELVNDLFKAINKKYKESISDLSDIVEVEIVSSYECAYVDESK